MVAEKWLQKHRTFSSEMGRRYYQSRKYIDENKTRIVLDDTNKGRPIQSGCEVRLWMMMKDGCIPKRFRNAALNKLSCITHHLKKLSSSFVNVDFTMISL